MKNIFLSTTVAASAIKGCDAFVIPKPVTVPPPPSSTSFNPSALQERGTFGGTLSQRHIDDAAALGTGRLFPLAVIIDVPYGFFTTMGISLGIFNAIMRPVNRQALEERAWQQRLDGAREARMEEDPTLTELDLIREEAEAVVGPYGPEAMERREMETRRRQSRVLTMDRPTDDEDGRGRRSSRRGSYSAPEGYVPMTDEEIEDFEADYGVEYDPYFDEPYEEDELPTDGKVRIDGLYGDRRYENGEVFYQDEETGLFWRQGCKPRTKKMWDF